MNIVAEIMKLVRRDQDGQIFRATVISTLNDTVKFQRTGWPVEGQFHPTLDGVGALAATDEILVVRVGTGYVVLGEVTR